MLLTPHPLPVLRYWKSRAISLPPLGHNRACNGVTLRYLLIDDVKGPLRRLWRGWKVIIRMSAEITGLECVYWIVLESVLK